MIIRRLIFVFILLFANQAPALELTVEECVRLGLEQNDNLKATAAQVEINTQDARIAYAELYPSIKLESSYTIKDQPPHFTLGADLFGPGLPPNDALVEGEKSHYSLGVRFVQPLFAGGRLTGTHQSKSLLIDARRYQLKDQASQLAYQIKKSFYQVLIRQHELSGAGEVVATQTEALRIIRELQIADKATKAEILGAESQLLFANTEKLQAEQAHQNALDDLAALTGSEGPLLAIEPVQYAILSPEFMTRQGETLKERNDLKQLGTQIDAASKNVEVARSGYYPRINLEASYLNQRETDITEPDIWEAGLKLEWSLFEAGKTDAEVARAKAEQQRLRHLRKDRERSAENEIKAALRSVRGNEALVEAHRLQLLATEKEHSYQLDLFQSGKKTKLDVLKSQTRLALENVKYRTAINQLRTSLAALEAALAFSIDSQLIPQKVYAFNFEPKPEIMQTTAAAPLEKQPQLIAEEADYPFAIQLGAFKSDEKAGDYLSTLQKNFPNITFETVSVDSWKKIRATQFTNRASAEAALAGFGGKGFIVHVSK